MKACQTITLRRIVGSASLPVATGSLGWLHRLSRKRRERSAFSTIDIIVSTVLLGVVLSTATGLCFRINQIWKGISHQRLATQELANHLDGLTRLNAEEVKSAIESLQASELCARSLHDPKLSGEVTEDELGLRVTLRIRWEANPKSLEAELAGWLIDPQAKRGNGPAEPPQKTAPGSSPGPDPNPASEGL